MTADEVEAEHLQALASLNHAQRAAIHRNRDALRIGNFSHHAFRDVLADLFERDALARSGPEAGSPSVAGEDIRREHIAALAGLTPVQRQALHRVERAYQLSSFTMHTYRELLMEAFAREAAERSA